MDLGMSLGSSKRLMMADTADSPVNPPATPWICASAQSIPAGLHAQSLAACGDRLAAGERPSAPAEFNWNGPTANASGCPGAGSECGPLMPLLDNPSPCPTAISA